MKNFIIALMLIPCVSFADCSTSSSDEIAEETMEITTDVPSHLKGATITVTLADGSSSTVSAEKFKVVARQQQFIVTKTRKNTVVSCQKPRERKNEVSGLVGYGETGKLNTEVTPTEINVETKQGAVFGLQYQRLVTDKISVGIQGQSNGTGMGVVGVEF